MLNDHYVQRISAKDFHFPLCLLACVPAQFINKRLGEINEQAVFLELFCILSDIFSNLQHAVETTTIGLLAPDRTVYHSCTTNLLKQHWSP